MKNEKQLMNEEINSLKEANDKFQLDFKREK